MKTKFGLVLVCSFARHFIANYAWIWEKVFAILVTNHLIRCSLFLVLDKGNYLIYLFECNN